MNVVILVPRRAGIPDRDRLWDFARAWWANDHPDWPIVEGNHDVGPFNRSAAINDAAAKAEPWDVAVIIDSDVLIGPEQVKTAVQLAATSNRMVLAFSDKHMLSDRATQKIMNGFRGNWQQPGWVSRTYKNACSSAVVVNHQLWDLVGGFDENFRGWGWEDIAFRIACETFGDGLMAQIGGPIWHMHHRTSHENNRREPTFQANERRGEAYKATHFDPDGLRRVMSGVVDDPDPELEPSRIPRILHRTIPERVDRKVDDWWEHWRQLHPGWELMTHQDPLDPNDWPETGDLWEQCQSGAQKAGLIRLEALWRWGGVYVDSDVEPYRSLEPLIHNQGFAAWEDAKVVPDAVLGAEPGHPAVEIMLKKARHELEHGGDAWKSGPGVTTSTLPGRRDWLLLPPGAFYPYHYTEKATKASKDHSISQPWCFCVHHWEGSWLSPAQKRALKLKQR